MTQKKIPEKGISLILRVAGLEPARSCPREILSLLCLPIPPYPHIQLICSKMGPIGLEPMTLCL